MKNKSIQIALFVAFILVAGGALYYGLGNDDGNAAASPGERVAQEVHILKYSDYQCPACKAYIPMQEQLEEEYGDLVEIEYRHFPLGGHQFARLAAWSAEAARNQGKYKEMHDMIFDSQEEWSGGNAREHFIELAEELELDIEQFENDIDSDETHQLVESQRQEGIRRMVNATPTFFVNGHKLQQNPQNYDQFKAMVELYMYRSSN